MLAIPTIEFRLFAAMEKIIKTSLPRLLLCVLLPLSIPLYSSAAEGELQGSIQTRSGRIVGGSDTTIASYPWQVALTDTGGGQFCGGSIIDERWVLTAAHCLDGSTIMVRAGVTLVTDTGGQDILVQTQIAHPQYNSNTEDNDIALLYLIAPLDLSSSNAKAIPMMTAALAATGLQDPGVNATITGWGNTSQGGNGATTLQVATVPIVANDDPSISYTPGDLTDSMIAAGYTAGGIDACQGDSGGPMVVLYGASPVGYLLAGATSWGIGCAQPNSPGVYARVSHFETWIAEQMNGVGTIVIALQETNLSGATESSTYFDVEVPENAQNLSIRTSGGTGDVDLYVTHASPSTRDHANCGPEESENDELCVFPSPLVGTYNIKLYGFEAYSGVTLEASYTTPQAPVQPLFADGFESLPSR